MKLTDIKIDAHPLPGPVQLRHPFHRDGELVKDCIQDLFLALWRNRETISETSFVKYYLLKSLRRLLSKAMDQSRQTDNWEELHFESLFNGVASVETQPGSVIDGYGRYRPVQVYDLIPGGSRCEKN